MRKGLIAGALALAFGAGILSSGYKDRALNVISEWSYRAPISRSALEEQAGRRKLEYQEYGSAEVVGRRVSLPSDAPANYRDAIAFDLNSDGRDELYFTENCPGIECPGALFIKTPGGYYNQILNRYPFKASSSKTSGFRDVFVREFRPVAGGRSAIVTMRFKWNGDAYERSDGFMLPEDARTAASILQRFSQAERNPGIKRREFSKLRESVGAYDALNTLMTAQMPAGHMIPPDKFADYALLYAKETGLHGAVNLSQDEFESMLFSHMLDDRFLDPYSKTFLPFIVMRSVDREFDINFKRHVERMRKVEGNSGLLHDAIRKMGRLPNKEEYENIQRWGASGAIREDKLSVTQGRDASGYNRSESPYGNTESRTFNPTQVPGDPRYMNYQQESRQREMSKQMDQATQQQLQQGAERGRQMLNQGVNQLQNLLQKKDPKQ